MASESVSFFSNPFFVAVNHNGKQQDVYIGNEGVALSIIAGIVALPLAIIGGIFAFLAVSYYFRTRKVEELESSANPTTSKTSDVAGSSIGKQDSKKGSKAPSTKPVTSLDPIKKSLKQVEATLKGNVMYPRDTVPFMQTLQQKNIDDIKEGLKTASSITLNTAVQNTKMFFDRTEQVIITPLSYCIEENLFEAFQLLVDSPKVDLNLPIIFQDNTPLMIACKMGAKGERYLLRLLEMKVDPLAKNSDKKTALEIAQESGVSSGTLQKLEDYVKLHQEDNKGNTELHRAIASGNLTQVQEALKKGGTLEHKNAEGDTPLLCAIRKRINAGTFNVSDDEIAIIKSLINAGAYLDAKFKDESSALLKLFHFKPDGWETIANLLVDAGANLFVVLPNGSSIFDATIDLPKDNPFKKHLLEKCPSYRELQNRLNLATVLGVSSSTMIGGQSISVEGGNYPVQVYELLVDLLKDFTGESQPLFNLSVETREKFLKGIKLSSQMLTDPECPIELIEEAVKLSNDVPVILSSGWKGHAISLVLYQGNLFICNRGEKVYGVAREIGVQRYDLPIHSFSEHVRKQVCVQLRALIKRDFVTKANIQEKIRYMGGYLVDEVRYKTQKHPNCSWASTMLGMKCAISLLQGANPSSFKFTDEADKQLRKFSHFSKFEAVRNLVMTTKANLDKIDYPLPHFLLGTTAEKLVRKIKEGKDTYGYYRKALDCITSSGFGLKYGFSFTPDLWTFYASLYQVNDGDQFMKTLTAWN